MSCCCCCDSDADRREKLLSDHDGAGSSAPNYTMLAPTLSEEGLPHYKITVLGSGGVGKSALTLRLVSGKFQQDYDPTIEDSYRLKLFIPNEYLNIDFTQNSFNHTSFRSNIASNANNNNTNNNGHNDPNSNQNNIHASNNSSISHNRHNYSSNSKYANRNLASSNSADMDGQLISLEILDTAGQEEFITLRDQWINHSDGFLLVYGVDSRSSLEETKKIFQLIEKNFEDEIDENYDNFDINASNMSSNSTHKNNSKKNNNNNNNSVGFRQQKFVIPCVLVGNKCDLYEKERECEFSQGQTFANAQLRGIPFFETSAKDQINNKECFYEIIRLIQMNLKWKHQEDLELYRQSNDPNNCKLL